MLDDSLLIISLSMHKIYHVILMHCLSIWLPLNVSIQWRVWFCIQSDSILQSLRGVFCLPICDGVKPFFANLYICSFTSSDVNFSHLLQHSQVVQLMIIYGQYKVVNTSCEITVKSWSLADAHFWQFWITHWKSKFPSSFYCYTITSTYGSRKMRSWHQSARLYVSINDFCFRGLSVVAVFHLYTHFTRNISSFM